MPRYVVERTFPDGLHILIDGFGVQVDPLLLPLGGADDISAAPSA
jgi:hypothetical protein